MRVYRTRGFAELTKAVALRFVLPIVATTLLIVGLVNINSKEVASYVWDHAVENSTGQPKNLYEKDGKHRGMSTYRLTKSNAATISELIESNIEWISIFPYLGQTDIHSTEIRGVEQVGVWSSRDSSLVQSIDLAHRKGLRVMLKPHIWLREGWRSNITFDSQENWNAWFENYRDIMLHYAMLAKASNTELLCIGTELRSSLKNKAQDWIELIQDIREIYSGKLTYAANWDDDLEQTDFWSELDYIGIQAYYPLTKDKKPSLETIRDGWQKHITKLELIARTHNKSILFTEVGYRNDQYATIEPWKWGSILNRLYKRKSDETQRLAYEALFLEVWDQPWFAGLYAWEWSSGDFPIHSKPSENVIAKWYGR